MLDDLVVHGVVNSIHFFLCLYLKLFKAVQIDLFHLKMLKIAVSQNDVFGSSDRISTLRCVYAKEEGLYFSADTLNHSVKVRF